MEPETEKREQLIQDIIANISKCVRCRFCFSKCPVYEVSGGWTIHGASGITQSLYYGIKANRIDKDLRDILMRCTTCRSCEILCEKMMAGVKLVDAIRKGRELLLEDEVNPITEQQKALESLQIMGNPYGRQPAKRTEWARSLDVKIIGDCADGIPLIYYVGCPASYDERLHGVAKSIVGLMNLANIPFGIMGNERCSGDPALIMGEADLFAVMADENMKKFKDLSIESILTTSPHDYNCFLNEYPEELREIDLMHYTQFFKRLLDEERLTLKNPFEKTVTYHDPCYLGKHNSVYNEPRELLKSVPGLELREMSRTREESLCCGGGGGRMWCDFQESPRLAEIRVLEAIDTGAEVLATACPFCLSNFEDALKVLDKEGSLMVKDISEILYEAAKP
ncbi:MAG: (Fe-S)-binding protein [Deltaproteobacteria bacterium]|nr:(Fe-S)-binding protein [Deltaproteobacteria bacterium]